MKVRNGLGERFTRVIRQFVLERAERLAGIVKNGLTFNGVAGVNAADMAVTAPAVAVVVAHIVFAVYGRQEIERLAQNIPAARGNLFLQMRGYTDNILHERVGIFEHIGVDLLDHILLHGAAHIRKMHAIGRVDVPVVTDNIVENAYVDELANFFAVLQGREAPRWNFEKDRAAIALMDQVQAAGEA